MSDDTAGYGSIDHGRVGIVVSRDDHASVHIAEHLLDLGDWRRGTDDHYRSEDFELRFYDALHLDLEGVADDFEDPAFLVFVSRHSGDTGPLLSTHFTGNLGPAAYGGDDHELAAACPNPQRTVLRSLSAYAPARYDVSLECTHHGPTDPGAPSMFVELGSDEPQWRDPEGAAAVARAVLDLDPVAPTTPRTVVAFRGGHYAPRPTRIVQDTDWACGHVAADWGLADLADAPDRLRADVVDQVFARSEAEHAVIDGEEPALAATIADLGYRVVSETWVRETDGVPLDLVSDLEADLASVDEGLRFGEDAASAGSADLHVVDLPADLLADANGVDRTDITAAARSTTVAYETVENGTRVDGRAAFLSADRYRAFVDGVCDVLERGYEDVDRREDEVVVHERAFDPERAAELGVPEGPKFGALAAGESVTVDGRTVHPDDVTVERTRRYDR